MATHRTVRIETFIDLKDVATEQSDHDGRILRTIAGPFGNIGMPGVVEDFRHFRTMLEKTSNRLSAAEIDELIQSPLARE